MGNVLRWSMGTWSIFRRSLGAWESLVAEIDGHMEYIAEVAWSVGNVLRWSLGAWGKLVMWLLLTI
ncbi:hypothetical protein [Paenibacillus odorifer]|uniref:hypothetical protein n=1 Tax=Paenibacillus TaxID=44249 RepID=UPI0004F64222|nr:hypothetical protein [Paenibacillus odorifer]AIQ76210.1 hypothetical protein PODO_24820 [Paenibacillus odorifer]